MGALGSIFQFHKGTIRTCTQQNVRVTLINFNSIKVRLEPYDALSIDNRHQFQFHKGTIRTSIIGNKSHVL